MDTSTILLQAAAYCILMTTGILIIGLKNPRIIIMTIHTPANS